MISRKMQLTRFSLAACQKFTEKKPATMERSEHSDGGKNVWLSFVKCHLSTFVILLLACTVSAQEDAYHQWVRSQLDTVYGITGGTWVAGETEDAAFEQVFLSQNVARAGMNVDGQPFSRAIRFTTTSRPANFWEYAAYIPTKAPIAEGDVLLLIVWLRGLGGERGDGAVRSIVGENQSPFRETLARRQILAGEWQQRMIPFKAALDLPVGVGQFAVQMGFMAQQFEIGGLAILNFGNTLTVDDLPQSNFHLDYDGRNPEAAWRAAAQARIEQFRKGDLEIHVLNTAGQPVEGAQVTISMQQHAFGFGTAVRVPVMTRTDADAQAYRQRLADLTGDGRSFNYAVIENGLKWLPWESLVSWFTNTREQTLDVVRTLRQSGMQVRGHNLVWPSYTHLPDDVQQNQNDPNAVRQRIENHIREEVGEDGLKGNLVEWDVLNEPVHLFDLADVFGQENVHQEYANWFNLAAQTDSNAKMYINDFNMIMQGGVDVEAQEQYKELIGKILAAGGRIDGIGIQGHVQPPLASPEVVFEILDEFAALVPDLSITEYDLINAPDDLDADYLRDLLTIAFSHPAVKSFLMWGFWDKEHWLGEAPLFDAGWNLKPSGQAYMDLVFNDWWTDKQGETNADGVVATRGFLGSYQISATYQGVSDSNVVTLNRDGANVTLVLDVATSVEEIGEVPKAFALAPNYPNPFNPSTTVSFKVPQTSLVTIKVYDILGREVKTLVDRKLQPGSHSVVWNGRNNRGLPVASGAYLVRMQAAGFVGVRKMLFLK